MKKTNKNNNRFTFNFATENSASVSITLPGKFENIFNRMSTTPDSRNSVHELCIFCSEYSDLTAEEKALFQEILNTGMIDDKLRNFSDLRDLVNTLGEFGKIENARNIIELGQRLTEIWELNDESEENIYDIGSVFFSKTNGIFCENGNYYYINKIRVSNIQETSQT